MATFRYTRVARTLHWLMAPLVGAQIVLGLWADRAAKPLSHLLLDNHVRIGLLILVLAILRLGWRLAHPPPLLPPTIPRVQRRAAGAVHGLLYALLLLLPASGYVLWAWSAEPLAWIGPLAVPILFTGGDDEAWRSLAGYAHEYGGYVIIALILLHIGAALWHQFVAKDMTIGERMGLAPLDDAHDAD